MEHPRWPRLDIRWGRLMLLVHVTLIVAFVMAGCKGATPISDTAPSFSDTVADQSYTVGAAITPLTLPSASGGNGSLTYSLQPTPPAPGLTFDMGTRTLSGTPTAAGIYDVGYRVQDDDSNTDDSDADTLTFTITVQDPVAEADTAPSFSDTVADQSYPVGEAITPLTLPSASGGNGSLTYSLQPTPPAPGLTFDMGTRTLSGTPTAAGIYDVGYRVQDDDSNTDDSDADTLTFTITVQDPVAEADTAPSFSDTVADQSYPVGEAITPLTLPSASGGNGSLTYSLQPTPPAPGLTFDMGTRTLSGTPTAAGIYDVGYRVQDDDSNTDDSDADTLTFTITVQDPVAEADTAPSFSDTVADQSYPVGEAITPLTLPSASGGNGSLTYSLQPTPPAPGLTFDMGTRTLSGTPTAAGIYDVGYRVQDDDSNTDDSDADTLTFTITVQDPVPDCSKWNTREFFVDATVEILTACIQAGADLEATDSDGSTPLHYAAGSNDNPAVITALLDAGADLEARDGFDRTPLHNAAGSNDNPAVITALLDAGADLEARDGFDWTPLHYAAGFNDNPAVTALLDAGADLEARDVLDWTPLHNAAGLNDNPAVITALLDAGADLEARDVDDSTPLHNAARLNDDPAVITALLDAGADLEARDVSDSTPLHNAAGFNDNPAVITALLDAGADLEARDGFDWTPLHYAAGFNDNPAVITALLDAGADLEARDVSDRTPLHNAAGFNDNPAVITALLDAGADLEARDGFDWTPLHYAAGFNDNPAVTALLDAGADLEARDVLDWTPLHNAAGLNDNPAVITALLDAGADLEARDVDDSTPLHNAARLNDDPAVITALLDAGAAVNPRDITGRTPLDYAQNPEVIAVLRAAGAECGEGAVFANGMCQQGGQSEMMPSKIGRDEVYLGMGALVEGIDLETPKIQWIRGNRSIWPVARNLVP